MGIGNKRLLVIGIDQAIPYLLNKFIKEGKIPNITKLAESGVLGEAYPSAPCDTPTNWATIATGASTAVHGVTSFYMRLPGEPLDHGLKYRSRTQLSKYCNAEYFWDVADRYGLTSFVFNYPAGWPSYFKKGAMSLFTWPIPESLPRILVRSSIYSFAKESTNKANRIREVTNINEDIRSYSTILQAFISIKNKEIEEQNLIRIYIVDQKGKGYSVVKIPSVLNNRYHTIKENEWSNWIQRDLNTIYGVLPCLFKLKVINLDPTGKFLKIQRSALFNTKGWTSPESFGKKLIKNVFKYDLPKKKKIEFMIYGKISHFLSSAREESLTLTDAIKYAKKVLNWDVCFFHYHPLDTLNHDSLAFIDKNSPLYSKKNVNKTWNNIEIAYKIVDEMVEILVKSCVDENTVIVFISDHGAIPVWKTVNIPSAFKRNGLIKYKWNDIHKRFLIDWRKTVAFPYMEPPFIWINLKNRDPHGIVNQADYENVRDQVIETLYSIKDPESNGSVIHQVIRKEDATNQGLNGNRVGDLIYFLKPPYSIFDGNLDYLDASSISSNQLSESEVNDSKTFFGAHAYYLPSTRFSDFSVSAPFIISGPGIKEGLELKDPIKLVDIAPTLAYILDIVKPANSQGKVLHNIIK
ncbi:MAG: alkaline phosphatase family protein [Candidatus Hermodarchaeota archaeon]